MAVQITETTPGDFWPNFGGQEVIYFPADEVPIGVPNLIVTRRGARDAYLDVAVMTPDQPYSYQLDGNEYVAIRRSDGRLDLYQLPGR